MQVLSPAGQTVNTPQLVVTGGGEAVAVWMVGPIDDGTIEAVVAGRDGSPGRPVELAQHASSMPDVTAAGEDDATITWTSADGTVEIAELRPGGSFSPPVALAGEDGAPVHGGDPLVAGNAAGELAVAFWTRDGLEVSTRPAGADTWTSPQPLPDLHVGRVEDMAVTSDGRVILATSERGGDPGAPVQVGVLSPDGRSSATSVSTPGSFRTSEQTGPDVAVDRTGDAAVLWSENDQYDLFGDLRIARIGPGEISPGPSSPVPGVTTPAAMGELELLDGGAAVISYTRPDGPGYGGGPVVVDESRPGPPRPMQLTELGGWAELRLAPSGDGIAMWEATDRGGWVTRRRHADGSWGPEQDVIRPCPPIGFAFAPAVGLGGQAAALTWVPDFGDRLALLTDGEDADPSTTTCAHGRPPLQPSLPLTGAPSPGRPPVSPAAPVARAVPAAPRLLVHAAGTHLRGRRPWVSLRIRTSRPTRVRAGGHITGRRVHRVGLRPAHARLSAHRAATIRIRLGRRVRRLLHGHRRLVASLTVRAVDRQGGQSTAHRHVHLRLRG